VTERDRESENGGVGERDIRKRGRGGGRRRKGERKQTDDTQYNASTFLGGEKQSRNNLCS
jgi:hypothetical protein